MIWIFPMRIHYLVENNSFNKQKNYWKGGNGKEGNLMSLEKIEIKGRVMQAKRRLTVQPPELERGLS